MSSIPSTKRFPFIDLEKALARADTLYRADQSGRAMAVATLYTVWEYSAKSSGGHQTIGALKSYGLIQKDNQGRIGLTENALRYFKDERDDEKRRLLKLFALRPKLMGFLWGEWGAVPPSDNVARSFLKLDLKMGEQQARSLLNIYKENLAFADLKGDDKVVEGDDDEDDADAEHEDDVTTTSETAGRASHSSGQPGTSDEKRGKTGGREDFSVQQYGGRLKITADVDLQGLDKLKQLLNHYEAILKLMN
jgi:hypothetical protein